MQQKDREQLSLIDPGRSSIAQWRKTPNKSDFKNH